MYCYKCGTEIEDDCKVCPACGTELSLINGSPSLSSENIRASAANAVNNLAGRIDAATGGTGDVELHFRDIFVNVFRRHTDEEANEIFACGSISTTPEPENIAREWPKPWYYSRLFFVLLVSTVLLYFLFNSFNTNNVLPGLVFVGAMLGPIPVLMFYFEVNSPRNISLIKVLEMFFIGGCLSLVFTILIGTVIPGGTGELIPSMLTGLEEETGKALAVIFFIKRFKGRCYILNGLLIGGAIGAGFAVFETAGYILLSALDVEAGFFTASLNVNLEQLIAVLIIRGVLAFGGHVAWAAVTGAAIVIAMNGQKFDWYVLGKGVFIRLFLICIVLHGLWDSNAIIINELWRDLLLCVAIWIIILIMINRGIKEINKIGSEKVES